jgi:hypothetical protein
MKFVLMMLFGTVLTRMFYHIKNRTKPVSLHEESLDFIITYVIYTGAFLLITKILDYWK